MVTPMTCGHPSEVFAQFGFPASQVPDRTRLVPLPRPGQTQGAPLTYDPATDQLCTQGREPLATRFGVTPANDTGSNTTTTTTSSTPSWLPGSAWVQGILNDLWQSASSGLSKLFTDIIDWATTFGFLFVTPKNLTYGQPVVKSLHIWVLGLLDALVSLILVVWGYSYMIGRAGDFRQSAVRLIVATVAANVSLFFFEQIIEAHNALCLGLQAALLGAGIHLSLPADVLKLQGAAVYAVIAYLSELLLAVLLSLQLLARIALLDLLIIVAPLGLVCFALPQTHAWARLWAQAFVSTLLAQFLQLLCIAMGSALSAVTAQATANLVTSLGSPDWSVSPVTLLVAIVSYVLAFKIPGMLLSHVLRAGVSDVQRDIGNAVSTALAAGRLLHL
jgi:hypothetical protein